MTLPAGWEMVIGLEVHCELATATKLFCGCRNAFGAEPNTNVCPVCLGLPGSLPVLNHQAVAYAMRIGTALHCQVRPSVFHRKNYFYPDMPKDYQVSQYDEPICTDGWLEPPAGGRVGIVRAHLEEDTGKTVHVGTSGRIHGADYALVDYNRAGVPLVEIVSAPDLRSPDGAQAYVRELRAILVAIEVSDARMEEGSLRVDANVSVREAGATALGTRCEIKNLNSIRSLGRAIDYEARRQVALLEAGEAVTQETRHWNEDEGRTHALRSKEEAFDYRYFPEPDLVPVVPEEAWCRAVANALPPLPAARRQTLATATGMAPTDVAMLVELDLDELVSAAVVHGADPRLAITRASNEVAADLEGARRLEPATFARLLAMEADGRLTPTQSKKVLTELLSDGEDGEGGGGGDPEAVARRLGFEAMEADALALAVEAVIAEHPDAWNRYRTGDQKVVGFLVGQVMRATQGKANGREVTAHLQQRANASEA